MEGQIDYLGTEGCCITCPERNPGCLCFICECTKCYWYTSPEDYNGEKGHCSYTDYLKKKREEEKSQEWLDNYSKNAKEKRLMENNGQKEINEFKGGKHGNGTNQ